MANHGCINGKIEGTHYSSPVPAIGLYIAGASIFCALMMLYDIGSGFWDIKGWLSCKSFKLNSLTIKRWLPCKSFQLNSLTLILLGIATKLTVDLTTSMPSPRDQLSKLTGTTFICISMGFLVPSLGVNSESECFTNMVSLSIFVIIVAVNICIQLRTGVIVLFFKEHIIVLVLMFLLLLMMWYIALMIKVQKRISSDRYKDLFTKGSSSMFERLKLCYLYAYCSDPQFNISIHPINAAIGTVCLTCLVIIMQATFRSLILKQLKFCQENSDYHWSMKLIVAAQIITVIIGTFAVVFRWLSLYSRMEFEKIIVSFLDDDEERQMNQTLGKGSKWLRLRKFFATQIMRVVLLVMLLIVFPSVLVRLVFGGFQKDKLEYFEDLPHEGVIAASEYIVRKGVDDIIRLKEVFHSESLNHLLRYLSDKYPSPNVHYPFPNVKPMEIKYQDDLRIEVCSLSIALLIKIAEASIPNRLRSILNVFREAKEIIFFIDETLQPKNSTNNRKQSYAKALWVGGDFSCLLPNNFIGAGARTDAQLASDLDPGVPDAINIITTLREKLYPGTMTSQAGVIIDYLDLESCLSIQHLYTSIETLFVDMLHALLIQLPTAIFKSLNESPPEEFGERVRLALEFLTKTGYLEERIEWIPPASNISRIITDTTPLQREITGPLARLRDVVPKVPDPENQNVDGYV